MTFDLTWSGENEFNRAQSRAGVVWDGSALGMGLRGPNTFQNGGAWSWFGDPRAVYSGGITYVGWTDSAAQIGISSFNHSTGERKSFVLKTGITEDDHANPGICILDDGKVFVTYSEHNGADVFWRISTSAGDISAWGSETALTTGGNDNTYPSPFQTDTGRIYIFYRDDGHNLVYQYTDNDGSTWSGETDLVTDGTGSDFVYFKIGFDGTDRFDLGLSYADQSGSREHVRHAYFEGGTLYEADGTSIGSSADLDSIPKVYDSDGGGEDAWIWDCSHNGGNVQLAFARVPSGSDHTYGYARWNGSTWDVNASVVSAGEPIYNSNLSGQEEYSGGMSLNHAADGEMYLSINSPGPDDAAIYKYTTADDGDSWSSTLVQAASPGNRENIRPYVPWSLTGPHADLPVVWLQGIYHDFEAGEFLMAPVSAAELARPTGIEAKMSAFWDFSEASGNIDESTRGDMPGTATALTYEQTGPFGYDAISFNGTTSKIITASGYSYNGNSNWALFMWIKTSVTSVNNYLFGGQNTSAFYSRLDTSGKFRVAFGGTTVVDTGDAVNDGEWHRVGLICDGDNGRLKASVDGAIVGNIAQSVAGMVGPLHLGYALNFGTPESFDGDIAVPALYLDELLSDADVQADYDVFWDAAILESAVQASDAAGEGVTATIVASLPANTSANLTVYSDTTPAGQTLAVANGTNDLDFADIDAADGDDIWWEWEPARTVESASPTLTSVRLVGGAESGSASAAAPPGQVATWRRRFGRSGGLRKR
jgi:hypothetical protein